MRLLPIIAAFLLSACGADGEPERQTPEPSTGISISGDARIGVTGSL